MKVAPSCRPLFGPSGPLSPQCAARYHLADRVPALHGGQAADSSHLRSALLKSCNQGLVEAGGRGAAAAGTGSYAALCGRILLAPPSAPGATAALRDSSGGRSPSVAAALSPGRSLRHCALSRRPLCKAHSAAVVSDQCVCQGRAAAGVWNRSEVYQSAAAPVNGCGRCLELQCTDPVRPGPPHLRKLTGPRPPARSGRLSAARPT